MRPPCDGRRRRLPPAACRLPPPPDDQFPVRCCATLLLLQRLEKGFNELTVESQQAYAAKGAAREQAERAFAGLQPLAPGCDILHAALLVLQTADPHEKARLTNRIAELWAQGLITPPAAGSRVQAPDHPARDSSKVGAGRAQGGGRPAAPGSWPCAPTHPSSLQALSSTPSPRDAAQVPPARSSCLASSSLPDPGRYYVPPAAPAAGAAGGSHGCAQARQGRQPALPPAPAALPGSHRECCC